MLKLGANAQRSLFFALAAGGAIAVLLLVAMVVVPLVVPAQELRVAAVKAITGTTGQKVKMSGDPMLRLFPTPRLYLGKVEFPLPKDQSLDAESVVARLKLWPLLFGQVDVADVTLNRPTLVLTGPNAVPAIALAPLLAQKDLPELRVADGTIAWRNVTGLTRELVSGIVGSFDRIFDGKGVAVAVDFEWRDEPVSLKFIMDDAQTFMAGKPTPTRVFLATAKSESHFRGTAALGDKLAAAGQVSAQTSSLRDFMAWVGGTAPISNGLADFDLSAQLKIEDGAVNLTDTVIDLDGNRADGALLVKLAAARPLLQGTFAADSLNLTPYGRMRFTSRDGRDWDHRAIDAAFLKDFDIDLRLSAGTVTMEGSRFGPMATSVVLTDGRLALSLGQAKGWGGQLRASATVSPRPAVNGLERKGVVVRVEAEGSDVALDSALDDIAGIRHLEGTGDLSIVLEGQGRSIQDIAQHISGTIALTGKDGSLVGFDVAQVLHRIERRPLSGGSDPRGGRTAFTSLDTRIAIKDGIADVEEMNLQGKRVRLSLAGTAAVGPRDLDLKGIAALTAPAQAGGDPPMALPFIVQGSWDSPLVIADPQSLLQRSGAAQPLLEAVRNKATGAAVRQIIESLTQAPDPVPAATAAAPAN